MDKLTCLSVFATAARLGSFTATSDELNMTQGAVSKRIAWLEQDLGFTLFNRTPRKITLTDAGSEYLACSQEVLEKLSLTEHQIRNEQSKVVGKLKISAPSAFATKRLAEPLKHFMTLHPKLELDISVNDQQADLFKDNIDIAIRAAHLEDSNLKAKKLIEHSLCYFASPSYLAENSTPQNPSELSAHQCITYSLMRPSNVWTFEASKVQVNEVIKSDSPDMIVKMALLGAGIAAMPNWMVAEYFENGELVEVLKQKHTFSLPMYAVYKNSNYIPHKISAFITFLSDYFSNEDFLSED